MLDFKLEVSIMSAFIGEKIRHIREQLGMTQAQLASRAGTTQQAIALLEAGKIESQPSTLAKIAKALSCELKIELVPKKSWDQIVRDQAWKKANLIAGTATGSTAIEDQLPSSKTVYKKIEEMASKLMEEDRRYLWK